MRPLLLLILIVYAAVLPAHAQEAPPALDAPLPPMRELLLDLDKNEKAVEAQARDYTYHVRLEQQEFDGKGAVKKTVTTDAESLTIDGVRVNRIVARNGKPLTPDEVRKENERIDKDIARARSRREKHENKGEDTDSRGDVLISASRILELGKFTNPRREVLEGRPTIVMDYAGDPEAKTHNAGEGIIRDLVGVVWIDEADRVLVRGEGHFLNDFKIGGGLVANIHKGFSFDFRASKINGEAWLPTSFNGKGSARILLFSGFNGSLRMDTSDYKRFHTGVTIMPGSHVLDENGMPVPEPPTGTATPGSPPATQSSGTPHH